MISPSGDAATAAQMTVRARIRSVSTPVLRVTPAPSAAVARQPVCTSSRALPRDQCALRETRGMVTARPPGDQHDAGSAGRSRGSHGGRVVCDLGQRAGELDPGRPAAHDHEGQPGGASVRIAFALRMLEGGEDPAPDPGGVFDRLQPRCEGLPLGMAEVVVVRSGGEDERIVGHAPVPEDQAASRGVEIDRLTEEYPRIRLAAEDEAGGTRSRPTDRRSPPGRGRLEGWKFRRSTSVTHRRPRAHAPQSGRRSRRRRSRPESDRDRT